MSRKMIKTASYYSITLCLTVLLLCSGAVATQARTVREASSSTELSLVGGGTCSSSTTLTNADRNTISALLIGTVVNAPIYSVSTHLCSDTKLVLSDTHGPERSRAPPVSM